MTMNILRLSTEPQSELIKDLAAQIDLDEQSNYLMTMLDRIVAKASEVLKADACSIYLIDNHMSKHSGERQATMRPLRALRSLPSMGGLPPGHLEPKISTRFMQKIWQELGI